MAKFDVIPGGLSTPTNRDATLERGHGGGDNGGMDDLIRRVGLLERNVESIKDTLARMEPRLIEMHTTTTVLTPTLATKAELSELKALLADKPGKGYLWAVLGVLIASIFGALAIGPILQKFQP